VRYCGVVGLQGYLQLAVLEEVRTPEPPIRLSALFFEPGSSAQLAAELRTLGDVVVAFGTPVSLAPDGHSRRCDELLAERGVTPEPPLAEALRLHLLLNGAAPFTPEASGEQGTVPEGAYRDFPVFETSPDGVFCSLQGRRVPSRRHPVGMQMRIDELLSGHVIDDGGELWHRRTEELDAVACALCAHRYAVGHASWLGDPGGSVIVLPGSSLPDRFSRHGVLPPVERLQLPPVADS